MSLLERLGKVGLFSIFKMQLVFFVVLYDPDVALVCLPKLIHKVLLFPSDAVQVDRLKR